MRFKKIYVEITNVCNMHCSFCIQNKRPQHFMTIDEFSHVINEIKPYTSMIYLHVLGEPLLHPQLFDFMKLAEAAGLFVQLTTNATLIDRCLNGLCEHTICGRLISPFIALHSIVNQSSWLT